MRLIKKTMRSCSVLKLTLFFMVLHMLITTVFAFLFGNESSSPALSEHSIEKDYIINEIRYAFFMLIILLSIILLIFNGILVVTTNETKVPPKLFNKTMSPMTSPTWVSLLFSGLLMSAFPQVISVIGNPNFPGRWRLAIFVPTLIMFIFRCFSLRLLIREFPKDN